MKKIILSITLILTLVLGCNKKTGSDGLSVDTKALLDATIVTESYNAIKEGGDNVVPNSTKHKREDCPNGGWITQGDGHRSRCPDCDPPYNTDAEISDLNERLNELVKKAEADVAAKTAEIEAAIKKAEEAEAKAKAEEVARQEAEKAKLDAEARAQAEAAEKTKLEATIQAEKAAREAAELQVKKDAEIAESIKNGVKAEPNDPVEKPDPIPSLQEQLAIEMAKIKLEREAREAAEKAAADLQAKLTEASTLNRDKVSAYIRSLSNIDRYNLVKAETYDWNDHWRAYLKENPDAKLKGKEIPGKADGAVNPEKSVNTSLPVKFDPKLDWRLPPERRAEAFAAYKLKWQTANGKCCPDCTCTNCTCMYPGQCLVEANGGNPVTKYTSKVEQQCSGGSCKSVTVQVPRITYKQPDN